MYVCVCMYVYVCVCVQALQNTVLLRYMTMLLATDVLILLIIQLLIPNITASQIYDPLDSSCVYPHEIIFIYMGYFLLKLSLVAGSLRLAYRLRDTPSSFNESVAVGLILGLSGLS